MPRGRSTSFSRDLESITITKNIIIIIDDLVVVVGGGVDDDDQVMMTTTMNDLVLALQQLCNR